MAFSDSSESQPGPDRDGARRLRDFRKRTGKPDFRSPRNWTLARSQVRNCMRRNSFLTPSSVGLFPREYLQEMGGYFARAVSTRTS